MNITVCFDFPPIPIRSFDFSAHLTDYYDGAPDAGRFGNWIGYGETKEAAVADLLDQIADWLADKLDEEECHD